MKSVRATHPDPGIRRCIELIGFARDIVLIGRPQDAIVAALTTRDIRIARLNLTDCRTAERVISEFAQSSFDAVFYYEALEKQHNPSESLLAAVKLLRPGGFVLAKSVKNLSDVFWRSGYSVHADEKVDLGEESVYYILKAYVDDLSENAPRQQSELRCEAPRTRSFDHGQPAQLTSELASPTSQLARLAKDVVEEARRASAELERVVSSRSNVAQTKPASTIDEGRSSSSEAAALSNRILDLEAHLLSATADEARAQQAAQFERSLRLKIEATLAIKEMLLARLAETAAEYENAWADLYGELQNGKLRFEDTILGLRASLDGSRRERDAVREKLTLEIAELKTQVSDGGAYVNQLLGELDAIRCASLADKAVMQAYAGDVRERSERVVNELRTEVAAATERERYSTESLTQRVEDLQAALRQTESRLNGENCELRERVAAAEGMLAVQTDTVIATLQAENTQLSQLVDTVQSSRFWRFKRWLNRLRGSFRT